MDPNISAYRFVNVPTYAYNYQLLIKEHSLTKKKGFPNKVKNTHKTTNPRSDKSILSHSRLS